MTETIEGTVLPAAFVPTPTREFNAASANRGTARQPIRPALKLVRSADDESAAGPVIVIPPLPIAFGSRALIYKQDQALARSDCAVSCCADCSGAARATTESVFRACRRSPRTA